MTEEVAAILRMNIQTVRRLAAKNEIPGAFQVGREWRFKRLALEEWLGQKLPAAQGEREAPE